MSLPSDLASCSVAEVMGTELYTLTPDTLVASAQRLAAENGIRHLLVLENGALAGIVCRADLGLAGKNALVGECMSSPVICVSPDTTLLEAADIMVENNVSCLPVVTGDFLVGILTRESLASAGVAAAPRETPVCAACRSTRNVRRTAGTMLCSECLGAQEQPTIGSLAD